MRLDVLVVGDANPDLVLRGDVRPRFGQAEQLLDAADLVLGGSAAITAAGCARLGLRTALLAAVGDDVFGAFVRERLAERGVELLTPGRARRRADGLERDPVRARRPGDPDPARHDPGAAAPPT